MVRCPHPIAHRTFIEFLKSSLKSRCQVFPDILAEVFIFLPRKNATLNMSSSVWVVGQVCRFVNSRTILHGKQLMAGYLSRSSWRHVSPHTPTIWLSVCVNMKKLLGKSESTSTSILSIVLQRSHARLLCIQLICYPPLKGAQPLFDLLRNESDRWSSFKSVPHVKYFRIPSRSILSGRGKWTGCLMLQGGSSYFKRLESLDG